MSMTILTIFLILRGIRMGQDKYYEYCIYTIKHSKDLNASLFGAREGTFTEKNNWMMRKSYLH